MKVYSHYYKIDDQLGLRWRTLLKFGNSWDIIGSVVMKNPGSAIPISRVEDKKILVELSHFEDSGDDWFVFSDDNTMQRASVLFASYYGKECVNQLSGVVQIFNLFYVMDPNEASAEEKLKKAGLPGSFKHGGDLLDYDINHLVPPVYLGYGELAFKQPFRDNAKRYFDTLFKLGFPTDYLKERYEDNKFYHPQYLCGKGCHQPQSLFICNKFKAKPMETEGIATLPSFKMPKEEQLKIVKELIDHFAESDLIPYRRNEKDNKTIRFLLPLDLQITVTATGTGYLGVRHLDHIRLNDYYQGTFPLKGRLEDLLFSEFGFYRNDAYKMWLAVKELDVFSDSDQLMAFIKTLHRRLASTFKLDKI